MKNISINNLNKFEYIYNLNLKLKFYKFNKYYNYY